MNNSERITVVLDANVLYPAPLRDYMLNLAQLNLYKPKWTDEIQKEWIKSLLAKRKDISRKSLESTKNAMNSAFPDANIVRYKSGITSLKLPDKKDRHVLAAAIKSDAFAIITFNTKDFPPSYLKSFNVRVYHPDNFIALLIHSNKTESFQALKNQVMRLRNPPLSMEQVLGALKKCSIPKSVGLLRKMTE
jgi:predicted nucleic acid-binding protein